MKNSMKSIFIIIAIFLVLILSIIAMIIGLKKSQENPIVETEDRPQIENIEDKENLNQVISNELETQESIDTTKYNCLRQYSENYVSVVDWMLEETIKSMKEYDFSKLEGTQVQIDLTGYDSIEDYVTDKINKDEFDIEQNFMIFCPNLYNDLINTHLLGLEMNPEYTEGLSSTLYLRLLNEYANKNYAVVVSEIDELLKTNKLTMPYNYNLCRLYEDSLLMSSYQDNYEAINFGLDYIKSADTFLISYFNISDNNKLARLIASDSVFPEFKPSRKITIKTTETIDLNSEDYSWLKILLNDLNYTKFEKVTYNDSFFDGKNGNITVDYDCNAYIATNYYNQKIIIFIECIEEDLEVNPYQTKHEYLINISIVDTENSDTTETETTEEDNSEDIETENETSENIEESTEIEETTETETVNEEDTTEKTVE